MFGKSELERLQLRKEMLAARSDANRMLLASDWQRLRSGTFWQKEAGKSLREHPLLAAALAGGVGVFAIKALRHPGALLKWAGRLSGVGSTLISVWKMFNRK